MAEKESSISKIFDEVLAKGTGKENEQLLFTFKGVLYPSLLCSAETFAALEVMEARKDDVLIVAYPKCGESLLLGGKVKRRGLLYQ